MDPATTSVSSPRNGDETELEQLSSDLQALKRLYGLLHKGPANEDLDEASRALLMKMLDDATQQTLLKQAKIISGSLMSPALERKLSIRSDRQTCDGEPPMSLRPPASPSPPSLLAGERPNWLNPQYSTVSSRAGGHVHDGPLAAEELVLARLASYRLSRTTASALPPRHRPSGKQQNSGLSLYRLPVAATSRQGTVTGHVQNTDQRDTARRTSRRANQTLLEASSSRGSERAGRGMAATSQHGTVIGSNPQAEQRDRTRRTFVRDDQSSPEGSNRRRSVSPEMSLGRKRLQGRGTGRRVVAESSSSTCPLGRLDSRLSLGTVSRYGSERAGRGMATPEQSSSSNTMATIHSRIRSNRDPKEHRLHRAEDDDEESTPWRRNTDASASSASLSRRKPRRTPKRVDSGSMYISSHNSNSSSGAAISYHSTSPTVLPESSASASYSPPPVSRPGIASPLSWQGIAPPMPWRGIAPPKYAPQVTRSMRRRRRQEVLAKRVERLRMLKNKIATVFHHHYHYGHDQEGPSARRIPGEQHHMSLWKYLGGMLHRTKGQDKKSTSRAVVNTPGKRPGGGGGGNMHSLFVAMRRHLRAKREAPASVNMWRKSANRSRVQAKKMHWWQRLEPRRGRAGVLAGSKLRRRLGR